MEIKQKFQLMLCNVINMAVSLHLPLSFEYSYIIRTILMTKIANHTSSKWLL